MSRCITHGPHQPHLRHLRIYGKQNQPLQHKSKPQLNVANQIPPKPTNTPRTLLTMADPFEVRMRFSSLLQHLTASSTAALKAASYALKHREMDEDLHSCILEQLERDTNTMNNKANIMYFIEVLCEASSREGHMEYVRMVQRDVLRVVDSVAPEDGSGRQNVGVVRTVR